MEGETLIEEVSRLRKVEEILKTKVLNQKGDDVCWLDIYQELSELCGMGPPYDLQEFTEAEFVDTNCRHFFRCMKAGQPYKTPITHELQPGTGPAAISIPFAKLPTATYINLNHPAVFACGRVKRSEGLITVGSRSVLTSTVSRASARNWAAEALDRLDEPEATDQERLFCEECIANYYQEPKANEQP